MTTTGASTGARVRAVRDERGMSLSALAAAAGVGKATLSELEAGRRNPTLDTLYAIAGPLGVPLTALVADGDDVVSDDALTSLRLHVRDDPDRTTEVYLVRVRPGAARRSPAHASGVREQLVVVAGQGRLEHGGAGGEAADGEDVVVALRPGTHHEFAADVPHAYVCTSSEELVAVDVIVTPRMP